MQELTLILTDLYLGGEPASHAGAPRLAGLETVLARGALRDEGDWRDWICRRVGLPAQARVPVAAMAHLAHPAGVPTPDCGQWWLAQCVHLEVGVGRVYMSAAPSTLTPEEWRELQGGFDATFAAAGFRLVDGVGDQAYLISARDLDCDTLDPARVRGRDVLGALPSGRDASALKRLMTEIQMWLHDHPVNIAREARGVASVNALWVWGGGRLPGSEAVSTLPLLRSDDAFLIGLWKLRGGASEQLPDSLDAIDLVGDGAVVVALSSTTGQETRSESMSRLERRWFAPAVAALHRARLDCLQVHANDRLFRLTRSASWRLWRARRSWTETLS